jgi:hypothetical protein
MADKNGFDYALIGMRHGMAMRRRAWREAIAHIGIGALPLREMDEMIRSSRDRFALSDADHSASPTRTIRRYLVGGQATILFFTYRATDGASVVEEWRPTLEDLLAQDWEEWTFDR